MIDKSESGIGFGSEWLGNIPSSLVNGFAFSSCQSSEKQKL